ncbi:glycosyltransferase [Streptomyces sp. PA03-6a]|nr:glycosyltransferase [Streptomyces sp. PA03-6a]
MAAADTGTGVGGPVMERFPAPDKAQAPHATPRTVGDPDAPGGEQGRPKDQAAVTDAASGAPAVPTAASSSVPRIRTDSTREQDAQPSTTARSTAINGNVSPATVKGEDSRPSIDRAKTTPDIRVPLTASTDPRHTSDHALGGAEKRTGLALDVGGVQAAAVRVRDRLDRDVAGLRDAGQDPFEADLQWCVTAVEHFLDEVHPDGSGHPFPAAGRTADDAAVGSGASGRLGGAAPWREVGSWDAVSGALKGREPGAAAVGLTRSPFGRGHAVVAYMPRDTNDRGQAPVWVEIAPGREPSVSSEPPATPPVEAAAIVVDHHGTAVPDALERFTESSSTAHAVLDPSSDRRFGAPSGSGGWLSRLDRGGTTSRPPAADAAPSRPQHPREQLAPVVQRLADVAAKDADGVLGHAIGLVMEGRLSAARVLRGTVRQQAAADPGRQPLVDDIDRVITNMERGFADPAIGSLPGAVEIPRTVNFVWLGRPMKDAAVSNVTEWAVRAKESGWKVQMWTDTGRNGHGAAVSTWDKGRREALRGLGVEFREITELLPKRPVADFRGRLRPDPLSGEPGLSTLRDLYQKGRDATEAGVYPALSDAARYAVLWREGGVYADVDIAPGGIDLKAPMPRVGVSDIPYLPPMIRDGRMLEQTKALAAEELGKPAGEVSLKEAVDHRVSLAEFNNNFFVVPPRSDLMGNIVGAVAKSPMLDDLLDVDAPANGLSGIGAALTGPSALAKALITHFESLGVPNAGPHEQASALDPGHAAQWSELGWITEESDNQGYEANRFAGAGGHTGSCSTSPPRARHVR